MSPLFNYLLLLLAIAIIGAGLVRLFRLEGSYGTLVPVALITGVGCIAVVPFVLQLFYVPITKTSVFSGIGIETAVALIPLALGFRKIKRFRLPRLRMYELPFIIITGILVFISVWRCFYNPVAARDMLTGPEVIAKYAVSEHTMINSLFKVDIDVNNNPFKPPSVTSLQIIYKLAGFPFGQVWLSILFVSFTIFLYQVVVQKVHPVIAGLLVLLFLAMPEVYAYTFLLLYDYSNMVFFAVSCYFLNAFYKTGEQKNLLFSGFLMGIAVYFRAETLLFTLMLLPLIVRCIYRQRMPVMKFALLPLAFILLPVICYLVPNELYNKHYLPIHYNAVSQVNHHFWNLGSLIGRFWDMNSVLIFSNLGIELYSYFIYTFIILFLAEFIIKRKFNEEARFWLYCVAVIYFGLPLVGHFIPLMDLTNTTKRGMFKLFPFMLFYMANNEIVLAVSGKIRNWELSEKVTTHKQRPVAHRQMHLKHPPVKKRR